jgi:hypothetical protein
MQLVLENTRRSLKFSLYFSSRCIPITIRGFLIIGTLPTVGPAWHRQFKTMRETTGYFRREHYLRINMMMIIFAVYFGKFQMLPKAT